MSKEKSFKDTWKYSGTYFMMESYSFALHSSDRQSQEAATLETSWSASPVSTVRQQGQKVNYLQNNFNPSFIFLLFFVFNGYIIQKTKENVYSFLQKGSIYPLLCSYFFGLMLSNFHWARREGKKVNRNKWCIVIPDSFLSWFASTVSWNEEWHNTQWFSQLWETYVRVVCTLQNTAARVHNWSTQVSTCKRY